MLRSHARRSVRITVIVPAYRGWSTLPGALDALAPQLTAEHEVVLLQSGAGEASALPEVDRGAAIASYQDRG